MDAVDPKQRRVLSVLTAIPDLADYQLVGGTNLAIRLQHRKSVDLDLFCHKKFDRYDSECLARILKERFGEALRLTDISQVGVFTLIEGVKVDFVKNPYPFIDKSETIQGFRLAGLKDISAMKLSAVSGRGTKKDFYDLYELLHTFSLEEMLKYFRQKTQVEGTQHVLRALTYFSDAEETRNPHNEVVSIKNTSWDAVKEKMENCVREKIQLEIQNRTRDKDER